MEKIRAMIEETKRQRLEYRQLGAKPSPAGNSNQILAAACAIREQALKDALNALTEPTIK